MDNNGLIKKYVKKAITIVILIFFVVLVLCGAVYVDYKELIKNAQNANSNYKQTVAVDTTNGGITVSYDNEDNNDSNDSNAQNPDNQQSELLQLFRDKGYNVDRYFYNADVKINEENLKKILNAEIVTQFPYIKEWEDNGKSSGVIRFKRIAAQEDNFTDDDGIEDNDNNSTSALEGCLEYAKYEDFKSWIDNYNLDNETITNKENAMNHFTLEFNDTNGNGVIDITEYRVGYAVLKKAKVTTNMDEMIESAQNDISIITDKISSSETLKNADYTKTEDGENVTYTFEVLNIEWIDMNEDSAIMNTIEKYTMTTDLLFNLLTYSSDLDFVLDVADLAYNSSLVVGIFDSNSDIVTYSNEYIYNKQYKYEIESKVNVPLILSEDGDWQQRAKNIVRDIPINKLDEKWPAITIPEEHEQYKNLYNISKESYFSTTRLAQINKVALYNSDTILSIETGDLREISQYLQERNIDNFYTPKEYYFNCYFYENTPVVDIYMADVWYGYFNRNYIYNQPEYNEEKITTTKINNTEYVKFDDAVKTEWLNLKENIKLEFKKLLDDYTVSTEFYNEVEKNLETDAKEKFADEIEKIEQYLESGWDNLLTAEEEKEWNEYYTIFKNNNWNKYLEEAKSELYNSLEEIKEEETRTYYIRNANGVEKIYNPSNEELATWTYNEVVAENFHFSKLLKKSKNAYSNLKNVKAWFLENLEESESTQNIVQKVQYLMDQAYNSNTLDGITDEDLLKLYTTASVDFNVTENANFTETAKACHDYLWKNNYYYSSAANKAAGNYVQDGTSTGRYVPIVLGEPQDERYIDCSAYVTWVLMQDGKIDGNKTIWQWTSTKLYNDAAENIDGIEEKSFISKQDMINFFTNDVDTSRNGYIIVKQGHTEIFAGVDENGYYCTYNAGSTNSIRKEQSKYTKDGFFNHFSYQDYKVLIVGGNE